MNIKFSPSPIALLFNKRKAKHREYVGSRVWELHDEISRITFNLDRIKDKDRDKVFDEIKNKLWYMRKYQRYYKVLIT
tara:strand:+ start:1696 stop:1929 length:234 start_codon:yes stop_codon:yes gene_type:complete